MYVSSIAKSTPSLSSLTPRDPGATTEVLAANGARLGFIQADTLRRPIPGTQIPRSLKQAMVAIEDERFYKHGGIDYFGIGRAAVKNTVSGKTKEGGSTITMQLVRNLYISNERTYNRKIREAKLAQELEGQHSKAWILDSYLNTVPFGTVGGQTAVGAEAAARMYFSKPAKKLKLAESALLAGLPQAPTTYSPIRAPDKARARRNEVLAKMAQLKLIDKSQARQAMDEPLHMRPSRYFTRKRESYFFDYVKDELIKEYGEERVRQGGLKIHTTIDMAKQHAARASIASSLDGAGPAAGVVTISPSNGHILVMTTSSDYSQSQFNLAAQGRRQPGSAFKVMALVAALEQGMDPDSTNYTSRRIDFTDPKWGPIKVKTYSNTYSGSMSLTRATLRSDNTIYLQLALDVGPEAVKEAAEKLGITSPLEGLPAETLGGLKVGVTPLEMANAFATIASGGHRNRPTAITKVVLPDGRSELPQRFKVKRTKAFSDGVMYEAAKILKQNVDGGTGRSANIGCPAGGKTGTTDNYNDAWFVGFTPHLATSAWVGFPDAQVQMNTHFHGGPVQGATYPAQIWSSYMRVAKGDSCDDFPEPSTPFESKRFEGKYASGSGSKHQSSSTTTAKTAANSANDTSDKDKTEQESTSSSSSKTPKSRSSENNSSSRQNSPETDSPSPSNDSAPSNEASPSAQ